MTKQTFGKHILASTILTLIVIAAIVVFSVIMFQHYSPPNENNTTVISGTVTEVYQAVSKGGVVVMSSGEQLQLVYPTGSLYSAIGYDVKQLSDLLEGEVIQCHRMNRLPWAVEIHVGDITIDNRESTIEQMVVTRVAIVIVGSIMFALSVGCDGMYLKRKYKSYLKAKKKKEGKKNGN